MSTYASILVQEAFVFVFHFFFSVSVSLCLRGAPYKPHIVGVCFVVQFNSLCPLTGTSVY